MWRLLCPTMNYAWGSTSVIPEFIGVRSTGEPVAEVWIGAHPKAPSILSGLDGADVQLNEAVAARPGLLGEPAVQRFGARLPFLVKLLAPGKPLSLQVHPDERQAAAGYECEERRGVAIDDPARTYKDPYHKPEVMIPLAPTETLAGFRPPEQASTLLRGLELPWASRVAEMLDSKDMRPAFEALLDPEAWAANRDDVLRRCVEQAGANRGYELVPLLADHFPGDSGAAAPLLLNVVRYGPGQALFVPPRQVHAHVTGFGVEVMAASDNVIRAGLTPKHIDEESLLQVIQRESAEPRLLSMASGSLPACASEFQVSVVTAGDVVDGSGPHIALAVSGAELNGATLSRGEAVFLRDGERPQVRRGEVWLVGIGADRGRP